MLGEVTALKLRAKFHALHQNNNSCALKGTINRVKGKPRTTGKHLHITHLIGVNIQTMYRTPASQQHNPNTLTQRKGRGLEQTFLRGRCTRGQKQVTSGVPPMSARASHPSGRPLPNRQPTAGAGEDAGKRSLAHCGGKQNGSAAVENATRPLETLEMGRSQDPAIPLPGTNPK